MERVCFNSLMVGCALILTLIAPATGADKAEELTGMEFARLAMGGVLYDNWPAELNAKIGKRNTMYPEKAPAAAEDTWRCASCHGWDYKGKAGSISKDVRFTGIRDYANQDPEQIISILSGSGHDFSRLMSEDNLRALALFVAYGQVDVDLYIDRKTRKTTGNVSNGERIYLATCKKCHGFDGREINFGSKKRHEFIGTVANENPWMTFHKIRWGHPATPMISLVFLDLQEQLDVLAYCQALPAE